MSAPAIASSVSGRAGGRSGKSRTFRMRQSCSFLDALILDSPTTLAPFSKVASSWTISLVTGRTRPVMASTSLIRATAWSKEPQMPLRAARSRFPKDCPPRLPEWAGKR